MGIVYRIQTVFGIAQRHTRSLQRVCGRILREVGGMTLHFLVYLGYGSEYETRN